MTTTSTYLEDEHRHLYDDLNIEIVVERFRTNRDGDVIADVQPRDAVGGGFLPSEKLNLSSARSIKTYANTLAERPLQGEIDWFSILSRAAKDSMERLRDGEPHVMLRDVELGGVSRWLLEPFLAERAISMIYGAGGSAKSVVAEFFAVIVASGEELAGLKVSEPGPVLVLDWEDDAETWAERLRAICRSVDIDPDSLDIAHQRMTTSLHDSAREIRKKAATIEARLIIIDSVGMASGGDPNDAGAIIRCLLAARSLRIPVLAIHHLAKDVKNPVASGPYGSVYASNEVRLSFFVATEQAEGSNTARVVLTAAKSNRSMKVERRGFAIVFDEADGLLDTIHVSAVDGRGLPRDEASPSSQRYDTIRWMLEVGPRTTQQVATFLATSEQRARNVLNNADDFVRLPGPRPFTYAVKDGTSNEPTPEPTPNLPGRLNEPTSKPTYRTPEVGRFVMEDDPDPENTDPDRGFTAAQEGEQKQKEATPW